MRGVYIIEKDFEGNGGSCVPRKHTHTHTLPRCQIMISPPDSALPSSPLPLSWMCPLVSSKSRSNLYKWRTYLGSGGVTWHSTSQTRAGGTRPGTSIVLDTRLPLPPLSFHHVKCQSVCVCLCQQAWECVWRLTEVPVCVWRSCLCFPHNNLLMKVAREYLHVSVFRKIISFRCFVYTHNLFCLSNLSLTSFKLKPTVCS